MQNDTRNCHWLRPAVLLVVQIYTRLTDKNIRGGMGILALPNRRTVAVRTDLFVGVRSVVA